ncbi:GyrI-like domain-containing protein [Lentilactobacillus dabitei]|uniref:GyrI-like domain-containing protein n=1 Tax=Lentilactobacillus dabitei TaxID=2831523 RepID=UPI00201C7BB9|nr:GyrI-like domain-containing protein [Lentilactobacillus dabitei]
MSINYFKLGSVFHFNWGYAISTGRPSTTMECVKVNIEHMTETKVVYFRRIGAYGVENRKLMDSFKQWIKSERLFQESTILGIALDNPQNVSSVNCRYDTCLITDRGHFKNDRIKQRVLTAGNYAVFQIAHIETAINEFYQKMERIICEERFSTINKPIIERYQQKLVKMGYCEILIPVE